MKLIFLASSPESRALLASSLRGLGLRAIRTVSTWDELMAEVLASRPDLALLEYASIATDGAQTLAAADWALRAMKIPAIVAIPSGDRNARTELELSTEFEHFIVAPYDQAQMAATISDAVGSDGWLKATREVPVVELSMALDLMDFTADDDDVPPPTDEGDFVAAALGAFDGAEQTAPRLHAIAQAIAGPTASLDGRRGPDPVDAFETFDAQLDDLFAGPPVHEREHSAISADDTDISAILSAPREPAGAVSAATDDADEITSPPVRPASPIDQTDDPASTSPPRAGAWPSPRPHPHHPWPHGIPDTAELDAADTQRMAPAAPTLGAPVGGGIKSDEPVTGPTARRQTGPERAIITGPHSAVGSRSLRESSTSGIKNVVPLPGTSPLQRTMRLPSIEAGELAATSVVEVFNALSVAGATGRLRFANATLRREVVLLNGTPGKEDASTTGLEISKIVGTFAWRDGTYVFVPERVGAVSFVPFCAAPELVYRGIESQVSMNEIARVLGGRYREYPVYSNQIARIENVRALDRVRAMLVSFDGTQTFERAMGALGVGPEDVLRAVYFGEILGLIAFSPVPTTAPCVVTYLAALPGATTPEAIAAAAAAAASPPSGPQRVQRPVVSADPEGDRAEQEAAAKLQEIVSRMEKADCFGILGVEPGCGKDAINDRYYELVREYHPDRFSRSPSSRSRTLAERIFVLVRNATNEAKRRESGDFTGSVPRSSVRPTIAQSAVGRPPAATPPGVGSVTSGSAATSPASGSRVADVLDRLRKTSGAGSAVPRVPGPSTGIVAEPGSPVRAVTGQFAAVGGRTNPPGMNRTQTVQLTPEQMVRNARRLVDGGAWDKALETLQQARAKGAEGPPVEGLERFIAFSQQKVTPREVLTDLEKLIASETNDVERARLHVLRGHVGRTSSEDGDTVKDYTAATKLDSTNEEASRWLRHVKMRETKKPAAAPANQSLLDKLKNTKITFGASKSK